MAMTAFVVETAALYAAVFALCAPTVFVSATVRFESRVFVASTLALIGRGGR